LCAITPPAISGLVQGDAAGRVPALAGLDHGVLDVLQRRVGDLVLDVDGGAFHLGKAHAAAHEVGVAVGFEEGGGFFHAGLDLDPVGVAVVEHLGEAGVGRVGLEHRHDVGGLERVGHLFDLGAAGVAQLDPGDFRALVGRVDREAAAQLADVQRAGREVFLAVGHEDEEAAVGGVVAHQHGAVVGHDLDQLVRDAAHVVVLPDVPLPSGCTVTSGRWP
jgi:hypothetical protein